MRAEIEVVLGHLLFDLERTDQRRVLCDEGQPRLKVSPRRRSDNFAFRKGPAAVRGGGGGETGLRGLEYVCAILRCDPHTVRQGREDVAKLPEDEAKGRSPKKRGAARKLALLSPSWRTTSSR